MAGWNGSDTKGGVTHANLPQKKAPSALRGIIAGAVVVVVLAVGLVVMLSGGDDKPKAKAEKKSAAIKEVTPIAAPKTAAEKKSSRATTNVAEKARGEKKEESINPATGLPWNCVADFRVKKKPGVKALFENPVQAQLQEYVQAGRDVPPPDRVTDKEALLACIEGVKFSEDDTEADRAKKEGVKALLDELKAWLKEGRHADDFFAELQKRQENEHETMSLVKDEILTAAAEGDDEKTKLMMEAGNKLLAEKGLPPVRIKKLRHLQTEEKENQK